MKMPELTQDQVMEILDKCYNEAVNGLAKSKNCVDLASEYLNRYPNTEIASKNNDQQPDCYVHDLRFPYKPWWSNNAPSCTSCKPRKRMVHANKNDWDNCCNVWL